MVTRGRAFDLVLFGATGHTGSLTAEYLARVSIHEPIRWAIAGRDWPALQRLHKRLMAINPDVRHNLGLMLADLEKPDSLDRMCSEASVVLSTAGPYLPLGENLIKACLSAECDYADLCDEPEFIARLVADFDAVAKQRRLRILNGCGFDSVPHDVGVLFALNELAERIGRETVKRCSVKLEAFLDYHGRWSGGSWAAMMQSLSRLPDYLGKRRYLLPTLGNREVGRLFPQPHYRQELGVWALPVPTLDSLIVRRTAGMLAEYGQKFRYGNYLQYPHFPQVLGAVAAAGGVFAMAQLPFTRNWLLKKHPKGSGPGARERAQNHFQIDFVTRCDEMTLHTRVSGGDPGSAESAKMLAECGLGMALERRRLPRRYGVITPVLGLGERLLERLKEAEICFEVLGEQDA